MRLSKREPESDKCSIDGCDNKAERSISRSKAEEGLEGLTFRGEGKRASLCKEHYRKYKKNTKEDRELEMLGR
jgi:hypothetical protein